jgi:prepilin-type N-terminal cleavage/methylation domain-containing protein
MDVADRVNFPVAHLHPCRQISLSIIARAKIPPFQPTTMKTQTRCFPARFRAVRGFTLLEVLVSMYLFTMVALGVYSVLVKSYELVAMARNRDNARAVLQSFGDQFLRLQVNDASQQPTALFRVTDITYPNGTGSGLTWIKTDGTPITGTDTDGLQVNLGTPPKTSQIVSNKNITATVREIVRELDPMTGVPATPPATVPFTAAGKMLQAQFTITYKVGSIPCTQTLTVARSVQ